MSGCLLDAQPEEGFATLIDQMLQDNAQAIPNLGHVQVLLPELNQAQQFRTQLLDRAKRSALISPRLNTLRGWVEEQMPPPGRLLNTHARELMLVETLRELEPFGPNHHPWTLADSLLRLFDELQLSQHSAANLAELFTGGDAVHDELSHFSEAAQKINVLWQDFQTQQIKENASDRISLYRQSLDKLTAEMHRISGPLYLIGINWLHARELRLIEALLKSDKLTVIARPEQPIITQLHQLSMTVEDSKQPATEKKQLLDAVFNTKTATLKQRTTQLAAQYPESPIKNHLQIFAANSDEQEARAVDLQTRYWLLSGKQRIAIITEDRRLARRISALLQNAGLTVQDSAGWPLSTTMAAGVFQRWLSTVENDFFHLSLLDVLKSGFLPQGSINIEAVYHFEKDIIERENIACNLEQYQIAIKDRSTRLDFSDNEYSAAMLQMLQHIHTAATPLLPLLHGHHEPELLLDALTESLKLLGLHDGFELDPAGQRILQELIDLRISLQGRTIKMHWAEFCLWLQRALETHNFRPAKNDSQVNLINLAQSNTGNYDALILAGASLQHLPGKRASNDFFNDNVRRELGLKNRDIHRAECLSQFQRILQAANEILITYTQSQDGEPVLQSPWVELLVSFHQQAYGDNLDAATLNDWLKSPDTELQSGHPAALPDVTTRPAPVLPEQLVPRQISASAHQTLIDCPYRFFAARGLNLKPREAIAEQLSKRDYGTLVHTCLQRYHKQVASTKETGREQAIQRLTEISQTVFSEKLTSDFFDQSWWLTWEMIIPHYIDWQIKRETNWRVKQTEYSTKRNLNVEGFSIQGRIDRIDISDEGLSLLDYKTGAAPTPRKILSGEDVQLLTYAQLVENTHELIYLLIHHRELVREKVQINQEQLESLMPQMEQRLHALLEAICKGAPLPAWGDQDTCQYCEFDGLCRRDSWI